MSLSKVIQESFNVREHEYTDSTKLSDFGEWDSLAHMFFITKLEEVYGIELTGDEIASIEKISDIKQIIQTKGKAV